MIIDLTIDFDDDVRFSGCEGGSEGYTYFVIVAVVLLRLG